jgi:hypothetical protein
LFSSGAWQKVEVGWAKTYRLGFQLLPRAVLKNKDNLHATRISHKFCVVRHKFCRSTKITNRRNWWSQPGWLDEIVKKIAPKHSPIQEPILRSRVTTLAL